MAGLQFIGVGARIRLGAWINIDSIIQTSLGAIYKVRSIIPNASTLKGKREQAGGRLLDSR